VGLTSAKLEAELLKIIDKDDPGFLGWPTTVADAATNWGNAYHAYASKAEDISSDRVLTTNLSGFITAFTNGITGSTTAAQAADAYEAAFVAYWTGATFDIGNLPPWGIGGNGIFGLELSSVVNSITPNVLSNLLKVEFAILSSDAAAKASALAGQMHTATTTAVLVLISGTDTTSPPAGPWPIINQSPIN
jgi:hypothetical protein